MIRRNIKIPRRVVRPSGAQSAWQSQPIAPNSASLTVSDYANIAAQTSTALRFSRPITDANGFQNSAPAARVSFTTNTRRLRLTMFWNGLVTRSDTQSSIANLYSVGAVLVDGVRVGTFNSENHPQTTTAVQQYSYDLGNTNSKVVTIVWPYWTAVTLQQIEIDSVATITTATRPTNKLAVCGDSISQGATVTASDKTWPFLLGGLESLQMVNFANGGALAVGADATTALSGQTNITKITYMIGYNNFVAQTAIATFQTAVALWITNARAAQPSAAIHVISPIYSPNTNTLTLAQYRTAVQNAESSAGDANTFYIDGLSIMTNNTNRLYEGATGVHPNDLGASEIATNLAALI
jgi:hypothetical protein